MDIIHELWDFLIVGETHTGSEKETDHTTEIKRKPTDSDKSNNQLLKKCKY